MSNVLFVPNGFIGDRLLTTSAMAVVKRYYPEMKTSLYLSPDFWYMDEILLATGVVDGIVRDDAELVNDKWDNVIPMPHCRFDTNPVQVYTESFIENLPIGADLSPALIDVSKLSVRDLFHMPVSPYITYQVDWQNRTSLNVLKVINELVRKGIKCVSVGKDIPQRNLAKTDSEEFAMEERERRYSINETMKLIAGATLHLCMNGGTAMFAGYVNTRCAMTTDWFYIRHNEKRLDPYAYLNWIKQTPRDMSTNPKHHMFNPVITEDELIVEVIHLLNSELGEFRLPPNLVKHPELFQYFERNASVPAFTDK